MTLAVDRDQIARFARALLCDLDHTEWEVAFLRRRLSEKQLAILRRLVSRAIDAGAVP